MSETYKVESVMKTGKNSPQFGSEYYVKFYESEQTFPLWFKSDPQVDSTLNGTIEGSKFKKEKKEWNPNPSTAETPVASPAPQSSRPYKDNSDGMRQGMCINNAANYINTVATDTVDAKTWAKTVHQYATELYKLGDLDGNN